MEAAPFSDGAAAGPVVAFVAADGGAVELDVDALRAAPECLLTALAAGRLPATRDVAGRLAVGVSTAALRAAAALLSPAGAPTNCSSAPELAAELDYLNLGGTPAAQRAVGAAPDAVLLWFGGGGGGGVDAGSSGASPVVIDTDTAPLQLAAVRDLCAATGDAVVATPQLVAGTFALRLRCNPGCESCSGADDDIGAPSPPPPPPLHEPAALTATGYRGVRWLPHEAAFEAFLPLARAELPLAADGGGSGPRARDKARLLGRPQPVSCGSGSGSGAAGGGFRYYVAPSSAPARDSLSLGLFPTAVEAARAHDAAVLRAARQLAGRRADDDDDDDGPLFAAAAAPDDLAEACKSDSDHYFEGCGDVASLLNYPRGGGTDVPNLADAPLFGMPPRDNSVDGRTTDDDPHAAPQSLPPVGPLAVTAHLLAAALGWQQQQPSASAAPRPESELPPAAATPLPAWAQRAAAVVSRPLPRRTVFASVSSSTPHNLQRIPARGLPAALAAAVASSPASPQHHACLRAVAGVALPPGGRKVVVYRCAVTTAASAADAGDASLLLRASVPTLPAYASPHPLVVAVRVGAQWAVHGTAGAAAAAVAVDAAVTLSAHGAGTQSLYRHWQQVLRLRPPVSPAAAAAPALCAEASCVLATPPAGGVGFSVTVRCTRAAADVDGTSRSLRAAPPPLPPLDPRLAVTVLLTAYEEGVTNAGALMEQHAFVSEVPVLG